MEEQIRRLSAHYGWHLSDEEVHRIAAEALVQGKVLQRLNQVELGQTRPIMGIFKARRAAAAKRRRK